MQITRERVVAEIAKLTAERANHVAQIDQIAANVNCVDGCLIECRAMLAILDTPEPETPEQREARERDAGMARAKPPSYYCTTDGRKWCNAIALACRCDDCPESAPVEVVTNIPALKGYTFAPLDAAPAPEMLPVEIPAEADDLSLVERAEPEHSANCECHRCETGAQ